MPRCGTGRRSRRFSDYLVAALFLLGIAALSAYFASIVAQELTGRAFVIDGDSLVIAGEKVRLEGIDAPELGQNCNFDGNSSPCGRSSRTHLRQLIGSDEAVCDGWQRDKYERLLVQCSAGGRELNRLMVRDGWAVSFGDFEGEELSAKRARRGLWRGRFVRPSTWRAKHTVQAGSMDGPHDTSFIAFAITTVSRIIQFAINGGE